MVTPFIDLGGEPAVRGLLYSPAAPPRDGFVLAHGAGSNCQSKLLVQMATVLAQAGLEVLCIDLPFRQARPHGPPFPSSAKKDRDGIQRALRLMRSRVPCRVFAGGHSYGGRQTTMLIAEGADPVEGMLLLSYPLHPPGKLDQLRTEHFPSLKTPVFFVHGTRDPFGSIAEMDVSLSLITSPRRLVEVSGAGHDLQKKSSSAKLINEIVSEFLTFINGLK